MNRRSLEKDLAAADRGHRRKGIEDSGLAGAVGPDQSDDLPPIEVQRYVFQRMHLTIVGIDVPDLEHRYSSPR